MRYLSVICGVVFLFTGLVGCGSDDSPAQVRAQEAEQWLFILTASSGTMDQSWAQRSGDTYTLTLQDPSEQVARFTDRPVRKTGTLSLDLFLLMWDEGSDSFLADPPNAAIEYMLGDTAVVHVVELTNPRRGILLNSLTFDAEHIPPIHGLSHYVGRTTELQVGIIDAPTLFIDEFDQNKCVEDCEVSCSLDPNYDDCVNQCAEDHCWP